MLTTYCEPDMGWLVESLTTATGIRTDITFEAWKENRDRVHCQACIAREVRQALSSPHSELAPTLQEFFIRHIEARRVEPE